MKAFHSFWSKPCFAKNYDKIKFNKFEILTMILSALEWRKHNGSIKMITDSSGKNFFDEIGITSIWNDGVETCLDQIKSDLDPVLFWAAGKLFALKLMNCPCVMLDTDLIIWKNLNLKFNKNVVVTHFEDLLDYVYPNPFNFKMTNDYTFPSDWDFSLKATNTSFLYMPNEELRDEYVKQAFDFMNSLDTNNVNPTHSMCFTEQRILPMVAKVKNNSIETLIDYRDFENQDTVTHIWGYKTELGKSKEKQESLCRELINRIEYDFSWYNIPNCLLNPDY